MKKIISSAMAVSLFGCLSVASYAQDITVKLNNNDVLFADVKPFIDEQSRVQIPVRAIAENAGFMVSWDMDTKTVSISSEEMECDFVIGSSVATVKTNLDGGFEGYKSINMDTNAMIVNDRTYIPVTYLAQAMSMTAEWDAETQTVSIKPMTEDVQTNSDARFPGESHLPKHIFANGYTKNELPENIKKAMSKTNIISGKEAFVNGVEDYNNSVDLTDSLYQQEFTLEALTPEEEKKAVNVVETPVFDSCKNLAVRLEVNGEPVIITVSLAKIDSIGNIEYVQRKWHEDAVDKEVTVAFDNLDTNVKYFVSVQYENIFTPEISTVSGCLWVSEY
ncbi:MAG: copper amine oxidase N-terminal domain-containing protein [bacterium]|nr:copper amine oxidase N-terminal domain-containing protein [bacterium]